LNNVTNRNTHSAYTSRTTRGRHHGFTLIELMVVVVILGILAAVVVPRVMDRPEQARISAAQSNIRAIRSALDMYKLDNHGYPSTDQGLQALAERPTSDPVPQNWTRYMERVPLDPWGKPYLYLQPGKHADVDVFSPGPNGRIGDEDDIGSWLL
jgi:general secretion pathway protein G